MGGDRIRPSLLDRLPAEAKENVPLMLELVYGDVMNKFSILETQVKGRLSHQESELNRADTRLQRIENCPCAVHRDPAHSCVILDVRDKLSAIEKRNNDELSAIKTTLARWGGGLAVVIFLLELLGRLLPLFWR